MEKKQWELIDEVNGAIIKFRRFYSLWAKNHELNYHEMLVLYTIREAGFCTQKKVCENYFLPKQTINNVITRLKEDGILEYDETRKIGREKAFVLSDKGKEYAAPFFESFDNVESRALEMLGEERMALLSELLFAYDHALNQAMGELR